MGNSYSYSLRLTRYLPFNLWYDFNRKEIHCVLPGLAESDDGDNPACNKNENKLKLITQSISL